MSRTDVMLEAIRAVVEARRAEIDAAQDLRAVVLDIKLRPGVWTPRAVVVNLERETLFEPPKPGGVHSGRV